MILGAQARSIDHASKIGSGLALWPPPFKANAA
jgi:hypothetical protein